MLGAYKTQLELGIAAIGGKDSMSGSFNELDVPPTLTSFAVAPVKADKVISQEFKKAGTSEFVHEMESNGIILSASVVKGFGLAETISKMAFGNKLGFEFGNDITNDDLFYAPLGSIVFELSDKCGVILSTDDMSGVNIKELGYTQ